MMNMAKVLLPCIDTPPEPFVARLLYLGLCLEDERSSKRMIRPLRSETSTAYDSWHRPGGLWKVGRRPRTQVWLSAAISLVDLLFVHTLIDYTRLPIHKSEDGVWVVDCRVDGCRFDFSYIWLRGCDVWHFLTAITDIPLSAWRFLPTTEALQQQLEREVHEWSRRNSWSPHDMPAERPEWVGADVQISVRPDDPADSLLLETKSALEDLFRWLHTWVHTAYEPEALLTQFETLSEIYQSLYTLVIRNREI